MGVLTGVLLEEVGYALRGFGTLRQPVVDAVLVDVHARIIFGGEWIEKTHALNAPAIALVTSVRDYDMVEWPFLGPTTTQPYYDHSVRIPL